jgi:hypothetical protein
VRPSWSVRGLAVLVAVVGVTLGAARLEMRRRVFLGRVEGHAWGVLRLGEDRAALCLRDEFYEPGSGRLRPEAVRYLDASLAWEAALEAKYRRAAARPWEAVEPDPPSPELWWKRGEHAD